MEHADLDEDTWILFELCSALCLYIITFRVPDDLLSQKGGVWTGIPGAQWKTGLRKICSLLEGLYGSRENSRNYQKL